MERSDADTDYSDADTDDSDADTDNSDTDTDYSDADTDDSDADTDDSDKSGEAYLLPSSPPVEFLTVKAPQLPSSRAPQSQKKLPCLLYVTS